MITTSTEPITDTLTVVSAPPERCAVVVEQSLGAGHAANAAALLALTLGARIPGLTGPPLVDGDGRAHPGLYPAGLPVLRAPAAELATLRRRALAADPPVGLIALPAAGQRTTDYAAFRDAVAATTGDELELAAVLLAGTARAVRRLTGSFGLLR